MGFGSVSFQVYGLGLKTLALLGLGLWGVVGLELKAERLRGFGSVVLQGLQL